MRGRNYKGRREPVPQTEAEAFLKDNYRLACQAEVVDLDAEVEFVPLRRAPQILTLSQQKEIDLDPLVTRRGDRVFYNGEDIDRFRGHIYGLAIDVGTTTIVMDLVDLESGESIAIASYENPQRLAAATSCIAFPMMANIQMNCGRHW